MNTFDERIQMRTIDEIIQKSSYGRLVKQTLFNLVRPSRQFYRQALILTELEEYPTDPLARVQLENVIFLLILEHRKKCQLPFIGKKKLYNWMLDELYNAGTLKLNFPGGLTELCLIMYAIESGFNAYNPAVSQRDRDTLITATKQILIEGVERYNLPKKLLLGS